MVFWILKMQREFLMSYDQQVNCLWKHKLFILWVYLHFALWVDWYALTFILSFWKSIVQVETLGEFGVFFTLFLVGLEFSPERLRKVFQYNTSILQNLIANVQVTCSISDFYTRSVIYYCNVVQFWKDKYGVFVFNSLGRIECIIYSASPTNFAIPLHFSKTVWLLEKSHTIYFNPSLLYFNMQ